MDDFKTTGTIAKVNDEMRVVWGWASVIEENGEPVVDTQGDMIDETELVKAAHGFIRDHRTGGFMHVAGKDGAPLKIGEVVESVVLTKAIQDALGVDVGRVGWLIGIRVESDAVWRAVKDGRLSGFSVGGLGKRVPVHEG